MGTAGSVEEGRKDPHDESSESRGTNSQPSSHTKPRSTASTSKRTETAAEKEKRLKDLGLLDDSDDEDAAQKKRTKKKKHPAPIKRNEGEGGVEMHIPARNVKLFTGTSVESWHKGPLVGKGATGAVYEAVDEKTDSVFCVKEVEFAEDFAENPADLQRFQALKAEVDVLRAIDHPNVVRFLGIDKIGFNMYIQMEFVNGGNIQDVIKKFGALSDDVAGKFTKQVVNGLCYLHEKGIIHRDIKGANILVGVDGRVKLADFGAAKRCMDPEELFKTLAGTPYWMAPEVVRQEGHNKAADVWSLGATVLQMVSGLAPYQLLPPVPALFKIGHSTEVPVSPDLKASPMVIDFITQCLTRDASKRPTIQTLREHPWMQSITLTHNLSGGSPLAQPKPLTTSQSTGAMDSLNASDAANPPASATAEAVARRDFLERNTGYEEEEIMDFIVHLTHNHNQFGEEEDSEDGDHDAPPPGAEPIDLEQFDDNNFDAFVTNLGTASKDKS